MKPVFFWLWARTVLIYLLLWLMSMAAAFEFGIICESRGKLIKLERDQKELAGKVESGEAILRGIGKGRMPKIP